MFKKKRIQIRLTAGEKEIFVKVAKIVLYSLLGAVALAVAATSPFFLSKLYKEIPKLTKMRRKYGPATVDKSLNKIIEDRLVELKEERGQTILKISKRGKVKLVEFNIDTIEIREKKLDGLWRFVIYDIPEKYKEARAVLRDKLREIGFVKIQKSVWVCPYECQDEINFITSVYGVEQYVNYIVAQRTDHDEYLKKKFNIN